MTHRSLCVTGSLAVSAALIAVILAVNGQAAKPGEYDPTATALAEIGEMNVGGLDWPQWGGWTGRNNTPYGVNIPTEWDVDTGKEKNIKWSARLGSQTYGNPVVANGKVYVGTNNGAGHIPRYPARVDLGCLLCFDEETGELLWQHSSEKLPTGRVHDWPLQGICDAPYVDGDKLWYVTSRGEVVCLDTVGFHDEENDGSYQGEPVKAKNEADVIWKYDMMGELGVSQHNMCSCSVTCAGDILLVNTSNGVDESHINIPAPNAPSFFGMDRNTGQVLWTDKSPGRNILHGQWSSPTYAVLGGQPQALFAGGDGWLYSFDPRGDEQGNAKLLWRFDCNPKDSKWIIGGRGTRNNLIATPVVYDGMVYIAVGQDPEHGEGMGHLWCIDPTKRGDVSPQTVVNRDTGKPILHRRLQAYIEWERFFESETEPDSKLAETLNNARLTTNLRREFQKNATKLPQQTGIRTIQEDKQWTLSARIGLQEHAFLLTLKRGVVRVGRRTSELAVENPNSAVIWHYGAMTEEEYDAQEFGQQMHRSVGTVAIKNDLLYIADFSGLFHCLNARTGKAYWTYDMFAAAWASPLIVEDKVYIGNEEGDVCIFPLTADPELAMVEIKGDKQPALGKIFTGSAIYTTPVVAGHVLFISNKSTLYAIAPDEE